MEASSGSHGLGAASPRGAAARPIARIPWLPPHEVWTGGGLIHRRAGWPHGAVVGKPRIIVATVLSGAAFAAFFQAAVEEASTVEAGRAGRVRATPGTEEPATLASPLRSMPVRAPAETAPPPPSWSGEEDAPETLTRDAIQQLLAELADDDVRFNAGDASWRLKKATSGPETRRLLQEEARPLLQSPDRQQRLLVTSLMMILETTAAQHQRSMTPDPILIERAFDWLGGAPCVAFGCTLDPARGWSTLFLMRFAREVEPELASMIQAADENVATEAAFIAGAAGLTQWSAEIADRLIPCLRDNRRSEDASRALQGLRGLGATVRPQLQNAALTAEDRQASYCIRALLMEIDAPGSSKALGECPWSGRVEYPVTQWNLGRFLLGSDI